MNFILMKDSMVINDMLYILQHLNLNFISFLFLFLVLNVLSCSITIVQHLRLDYCENFLLITVKTSVKGND